MFPPEVVQQARDLARQTGFPHSCIDEVGRLLHVLVRQVRCGRIGEIGTGCGVGTAWMATALAPGAELYTVEIDAERAAAARRLFIEYPQVHVLAGDWHRLLEHGPFALLFADGGKAKEREPETVLQAVEVGGLVVLDDLTPAELWPPHRRGEADPVRAFWLSRPELAATEVRVTATQAVILAVRIR